MLIVWCSTAFFIALCWLGLTVFSVPRHCWNWSRLTLRGHLTVILFDIHWFLSNLIASKLTFTTKWLVPTPHVCRTRAKAQNYFALYRIVFLWLSREKSAISSSRKKVENTAENSESLLQAIRASTFLSLIIWNPFPCPLLVPNSTFVGPWGLLRLLPQEFALSPRCQPL